ncbi:hypothetical protein GF380_06470 [Candidatus Uhrbacteria bacterium]|nr:hypothetical protein [Candidatus Uhrbacteria bacterium]
MADILIDLLAAIQSDLETAKASGTLSSVRNLFVKHQETGTIDEYAFQPPLIMVEPLPVSSRALVVDGSFVEKVLPIKFTAITGEHGRSTKKTAVELINAVEDLFFGQTFAIAEWVELVSKDYAAPTGAPYDFPNFNAATITFQYIHTDCREIPVQG